jgi:polyisoprenoid-binding protein YceI
MVDYVRMHTILKEDPMSTTATRTVAGVELPAPGVWTIDPGHAEVAFIGRHFMLTKIRGRFTGVAGHVKVDEEPNESTLEVTIDMASVNSGDTARDDHLRSDDFFDVANYPTATYRSSLVEWNGPSGRVVGDLTIRGVSRPVILAVDYVGHAHDPWGKERAVFSASASINRGDWGLSWNMLLETGGVVVSKEIRIEIDVETVKQVG